MAFPVAFCCCYLLLILNIAAVLQVSGSNAIEKGAFLVLIVIGLATRSSDKIVLTIGILVLGMILLLGSMTNFSEFQWSIVFGALNQVVILFGILAISPERKDADLILTFISWTAVISVIVGVIYNVGGIQTMAAKEFATGLYRFRASTTSAAYLSAVAMCATYTALQLAMVGRRTLYILVLMNFVILLAAGGRAALAVTVLLCAQAILYAKHLNLRQKLMIFGVTVIGGVSILGIFWQRIATRLASSGDSGRAPMWEYLSNLAAEYPETGIGFGHQYFIVPKSITNIFTSSAAHNDYIRLTLELGTYGVVIFYGMLAVGVVKVASRVGQISNSQIVLAFSGFLLIARTDNALASPPEFLILFFAILVETRLKPSSSLALKKLTDRPRRNFGRDPLIPIHQ